MHSIKDREYWQTGKPEVWTQVAYHNDGHLVHLDKRARKIKLSMLAAAILLASSNLAMAGEAVLMHPKGKPPLHRLIHDVWHARDCTSKYNRRLVVHLLALLGVLSISFSAIFVRLAGASPVTATFYRGAYAVPVLLVIWLAQKAQDRRGRRERWLAIVSGLLLALDLKLWHESIALVGAGLGTVIANVQVVFVALAAWLLQGERPARSTIATIVFVLAGVALTSGLARHDSYGSNPVLGAAIGVLAGAAYAAFLLVFRAANESLAPVSGPLLESTVGTVAGALACAIFDRQFTQGPNPLVAGTNAGSGLASLLLGYPSADPASVSTIPVPTPLGVFVRYYAGYAQTDLAALFGAAGLRLAAEDAAFLTKAMLFVKA